MYPVSSKFVQLIPYSIQTDSRITFYNGNRVVTVPGYETSSLPILSGVVTEDIDSNTRRTVDLQVADPKLSPQYVTDLLSGFGAEFLVEKAQVYSNGVAEWVPMGMYHIDSTSAVASNKEGPSINGVDRGGYIADDRCIVPTQIFKGESIPQRIEDVALDAIYPGALNRGFVNRLGSQKAYGAIYMDRDRWKVLNELAASMNGLLYFDPIGQLVLDIYPSVAKDPVWVFADGEGGSLIEASIKTGRSKTYNGMLVEASRSDGTTPFWVLLVDGDPFSPTYWWGPFGKKPRFFSSPLFENQEQALQYGRSQMDIIRMWDRTISVAGLNVFHLQAGDTVGVNLPTDQKELHVIKRLQTPIGNNLGDTMQLDTMSFNPPEETAA